MSARLVFLAALLAVGAVRLHAEGAWFTSAPGSAVSGQSYYVEAAADGDSDITLYKNGGWFAGNSGYSPYAGASTTDYGAQTVEYMAEGYDWYTGNYDYDYAWVTITVPNTAPSISWSSAPANAPVNVWFNIEAHGSDPDGNLANVFVWREWTPHAFNGGGDGYNGWSGNPAMQATAGTITFMAQSRDAADAFSDIIYHTVTVYVPNQSPTITWINAPASAYVNQYFTVQARGDDPDGNLAWINVWKDDQPFAFNGGGNGYQGYSDNNGATGGVRGTIAFKAKSGDASGADSGFIYHNVSILNRAPSNPTLIGTGSGVTFPGDGQYYMWVDTPITLTSGLHDDDGNLVNHTIYHQRITGPAPDPGAWQPIDSNNAPSNATDSTKVKYFTPTIPGRWDFHANGHDGDLFSGGASITVNVYGPNNGATFVSQVIKGATNPSAVTVNPGESFPAAITMWNSGDKPWTGDATPHRLGAVNDAPTWGLTRVALPTSPVNPNASATFSFNLTAPSMPGTYTLQWRMVEDGVQWFGATSAAVTVTVTNTPPTVVSATGGSISYGQSFNTTLRATDPNGDLSQFHLIVANSSFATNSWEGTSPDGWKWRHFRSDAVSGADASLSVEVRDYNFGVPFPLPAGTYRINFAARDNFPQSTYNPASVLASLTVTKATPNGTFTSRSFTTGGAGYTVQAADLNAVFANPYSGAVAAPSGTITYAIVGGAAVTPGTVLAAGQAHTVRATYPGDANYTPATVDATFTVGFDPTGDSDNDGMPNQWEQDHFDDATAGNPAADPDNDGLTNVAEYNLGKNPHGYDVGTSTLGGSIPAGWQNSSSNTSEAVGATAGELSVDKSGALNYAVALWTTPGTSGMEPKLSLNYSSQAGSGIAGFGWSLGGVSVISRGPPSKLVDSKIKPISYSSDDAYYLDGQRLIAISGTNGSAGSEYRTHLDSFTKVVAHGSAGLHGPEWFEAWTKAGLRIEFGHTATSRIDAERRYQDPQGSSPGVLSWAVTKISDTAGNYMTFAYDWDPSAREQTLTSIAYTGNAAAGVNPYASVNFTYEARPDARLLFQVNTRAQLTRRLKKVESTGPAGIARTYTLNYSQQPLSGWSLLDSLTETGKDGKSYPPLTFNYSKHDATNMAWENFPAGFTPPECLNSSGSAGSGFVDLDGDGRPDLVSYRLWPGGSVAYRNVWLNTPSGWSLQPTSSPWQLPQPLGRDGDGDRGVRLVDINGDGRTDFVSGNNANLGVWLNTGTGWQQSTAYTLPESLVPDFAKPPGGHLADLNGDGLPDLVVAKRAVYFDPVGTQIVDRKGVYFNTGSGWSAFNTSWAPPAYFYDKQLDKDPGTRLVDLNGDGLPDLLQGRQNENGTWAAAGAWLNTGAGWASAPEFVPPQPLIRDDYPRWGAELVDLNGDGLTDLATHHWNGQSLYKATWLNSGGGWFRESAFDTPEPLAINSSGGSGANAKAGAALIDLTQDGLPSEIVLRGWGGTLQQKSFTPLTPAGFGTPLTTGFVPSTCFLAYDNEHSIASQFVDLDANGAPDLVWNILDDDMPAGYSRIGALRNTTPRPNLLVSATNGLGVTATVTYAPLTERDASGNPTVYTKATAAGPAQSVNVIGPMYVVKNVRNDDGVGGQYEIGYSYHGLRTHPLYGSLGFETQTVTDSRTGILSRTTYAQAYPFIGMPLVSETINGTVTLSESTSTYGDLPLNGGLTRFIFAAVNETTTRDLDSAETSSVYTEVAPQNIDAYGNIKVITVDTDGYVKTTTSNFANDTTNWFLGRLTDSTVESTHTSNDPSLPAIIRHSSFTYNAQGLLLTETVEPGDPTLALTTSYGYDTFGNKTSVTVSGANLSVDASGNLSVGGAVSRTTGTNYDANGRFPVSTSNALGHSESYDSYDQSLGVLRQMTGANGLVTTWDYDGMGRKIAEHRADGTDSTTTYRWVSGAPVQAQYFGSAPTAKYSVESTSTGAAPSLAFHDAFGRAFLGLGVNGDGKIVYQTTQYDAQGRAFATSTPYFATGVAYWASTTGYDVLNRPLSRVTPDEEAAGGLVSTAFSYSGLQATVTDPKGRVARTIKNAQGWTIQNTRNETGADGASASTVAYEYDVLGNLTKTTADGAVTTLVYDVRGRKTSMSDPDMGDWQYHYNIFGELIWQKDAKGQITTMVYDDLGRLVSRTETEGTTEWNYDSATRGVNQSWKGKLASVASPGGYLESYDYDALGRPGTVWRTIPGATNTQFEPRFFVTQTYDSAGRPEKTIYPSGFQTINVYNGFGYLKEVRRADSNRNDVYWMADSYAVTGKVNGEFYGNGLVNDRVYSDVTGRLRAAAVGKGIETSAPFSIQYLQYNYDAVGNVINRSDAPTARAEYFQYDGLDRLTLHALSGFATVGVTYAANGNIATKSDVGTYAYNGPRPHAVTGISGGVTYDYDANGNLTGGGGRTLTWTSFNQVKRVQNAGNTIFSEFSFGAGHERIKQVAHTGTTVYIGSLFERVTGTGGSPLVENKHYIYSPTGRIAVRTERNDTTVDTRYFHTDGLGSITAVTDEAGRIVKRFAFDAWGKRVDPSTNGVVTSATSGKFTRGYTDHEQLDDLGLIHMNGRIYDPVLGRFLSADPNVDGVSDAQGFNRYSYVGNNPMGATDPTGFFKLKDILPAIIAIVVTVVVTVVTWGAGTAATAGFWASFQAASAAAATGASFTAVVAGGIAGGFAGGFAGSLLNGGSIGDAFRAGIIGGAIGGVTAFASAAIGGSISGANLSPFEDWGARVLAHGAAGGLVSEAQGGQFRHGFYASAASVGAMHAPGISTLMDGDKGGGWIAARTAAAAAIGGTASVLGGGKFANGAVTSAFQQLFNSEAGKKKFREVESDKLSAIILVEEGLSRDISSFIEKDIRRIESETGRAVIFDTYIDKDALDALAMHYNLATDVIKLIVAHGTNDPVTGAPVMGIRNGSHDRLPAADVAALAKANGWKPERTVLFHCEIGNYKNEGELMNIVRQEAGANSRWVPAPGGVILKKQ